MSMENNKLENNITIDKVICAANEFILDFDIVVQVCAGPGSVGLIVLGSLCGELSGAASIIDFTTGGTGCSDGTVFGFITPDGKNVVLLFTDFNVGAIGSIPNQSFNEKCCSIGFKLRLDEPHKKQIVKFEMTLSGLGILTESASASLLVNSNNILTLTGPFLGFFFPTITTNVISTCPQKPRITIGNQNMTAIVFEADQ